MVTIIHTGYRMEILEVEGAANLRSLNWVDNRTGFDRRTYEYSKICKSTDVHVLFCKHAILFGLSGSRSIYQPMFVQMSEPAGEGQSCFDYSAYISRVGKAV
jgi:hypothetical protein